MGHYAPTGLNHPQVSKIIKTANFGKIDKEVKDGKPIEEIANYYGLDQPLTHRRPLNARCWMRRYSWY